MAMSSLAKTYLNILKTNGGRLSLPSVYSNRYNAEHVELSAAKAQNEYNLYTQPKLADSNEITPTDSSYSNLNNKTRGAILLIPHIPDNE